MGIFTLSSIVGTLLLFLGLWVGPTTSSMVSPPTFQVITSFNTFDARNVSSWSGGGGQKLNISTDSFHPFAGREFGGGDRSTIRGTRAFGSGYPYGKNDSSTISGRPFPYGVWPLYWGQNIKGSDEYGSQFDTVRPGGPLVIQAISSTTAHWNVTNDETYYMLTDRDTAIAIMTSFVTTCHVTPVWPEIFDPGNSPIKIENVIQYYRASSCALGFKGYNNSHALNTTTEATYAESDPLPEVIMYSPFHHCIDSVMADALPIMDRPPKKTNKVKMILIIVFSIFGLPILWGIWALISCICNR
ncbi:hypothetical protein CPB86DRAFT_781415 [Serendipita vermifera]|nr:hypothetical protein CPB86DRAFT_781415 [Serendipita vermifera]